MTTPLQTAAQAVIDRWASPAWKDQPHTSEYILVLRKALDAEMQQSVEPVAFRKANQDGFYRYYDDVESQPELCEPLYLNPQKAEPKNFVKLRAQLEQEWVEVRAIRDAYKSVTQQVKPSGERAELIARLDEASSPGWTHEEIDELCGKAADMLEADAQQAKQVPMTDEQIDAITDVQWGRQNLPIYAAHRAFARAIEAHHGIGGQP